MSEKRVEKRSVDDVFRVRFSAEGAIRSRAREEMGPHAALSSRGALVPSSVPATAARCRRARADVAVVAGRGRAKKSAAPLSKRKKAAAVAARDVIVLCDCLEDWPFSLEEPPYADHFELAERSRPQAERQC